MHQVLALARRPLVIVAAVAILALAATGGGLGLTAGIPPETPQTAYGWRGAVHLDGGVARNGERYITSADTNALSEEVVAKGSLVVDSLSVHGARAYQYKVFVNGVEQPHLNSGPRTIPPSSVALRTGVTMPIDAHNFRIRGPVTGVLKVEFWAEVQVRAFGAYQWHGIGYDGAALVSGAGSITRAGGEGNLFQEGESITLNVRTGEGQWVLQTFNARGVATCGPNPGGFLPLRSVEYNPGEGPGTGGGGSGGSSGSGGSGGSGGGSSTGCASALRWSGQRAGTVRFTVPAGAFDPTTGNKWRFVLRNERIDHAVEYAFVIDDKRLPPEVPNILCNNLPCSTTAPAVGTTVEVSFSGRVNPRTTAAVKSYCIDVWYGTENIVPVAGSSNHIFSDHCVPAVAAGKSADGLDLYVAKAQFQLTKAQTVQMRAWAIDVQGRASGTTISSSVVRALEDGGMATPNSDGEEHFTPPNAEDTYGVVEPPPAQLNTTSVVLVVLAAVIAAAAVVSFFPAPPPVKYALVFVIGTTVLWYVVTLGGA